MGLRFVGRALRAVRSVVGQPSLIVAAACATVLAGCQHDPQPTASIATPRGATVAFESIDGPPPWHFETLVAGLNEEAQARQLAVTSRSQPAAYRVRGYLSAQIVKDETIISWVWDVFDRSEQRSLRVSGEEKVRGKRDWNAADDAMLRRIARGSIDKLAGFLTSSDVAPGTAAPAPAPAPRVAYSATDDFSPEAAGIFPIARADPVRPEETTRTAAIAQALPSPRPAQP